MKSFLSSFLFFTATCVFANMASPIWEGTESATAFSSRDIDILNETIQIKIDSAFKTAVYKIEYRIRSSAEGKQIPLLFYAMDQHRENKQDFTVWLDGIQVTVLPVPKDYRIRPDSAFQKFSSAFNNRVIDKELDEVVIYWYENIGNVLNLSELNYFEVDLSKGEHTIRVEYTAKAWANVGDWVNEYSFRYSLTPAKHWKSFGGLQVELDASAFTSALTTNLGNPVSKTHDSVFRWTFQKLPQEYITISYTPPVSGFTTAMMRSGSWIGLAISLSLVALHIFFIHRFRKKHPGKLFSWIWLLGSVAVPFLCIMVYIGLSLYTHSLIGEHAGRHGPRSSISILMYPIVTPVYTLVQWVVDRIIKWNIHLSAKIRSNE